MIGSTVSHYKILEKLGVGGMGVVYRAEDLTLGRHVAIKFLPDALAENPEALARFQREARAASALNHPHICTIHELVEDEGRPFIVMELMEGQTLKYRISGQPMPAEQIVNFGAQVADALEAAHKAGIVHRDLKPANLFVTGRGEAKVLDFGLAKVTEDQARRVSSGVDEAEAATELAPEQLTTPGTSMGTIAYMSPEQVRGEELDERTDLFSLGVVLFEMATGKQPFQGKTAGAIFDLILNRAPTAPVRINPDLPDELERILNKALEKDKALRYQHASDLKADLKRLQRDTRSAEPLVAVEAVEPPSAPSRRGLWVGLGAAALVLALVAVFWLGKGADKPEELADRGAVPSRKMIAVLPFQNLGSAQDEYFAIGMTQEIASRMASVRSVGVIATSSTRRYVDTRKTAREIGDELGAEYLVTGSVLWARSGDGSSRIRITPQLVSTADETQIWARSYDRVLDDVFAMQTEIATQVVSRLGVSLVESESAAVMRLPTDNLEAYDAYLRATAVRVDNNDPSSILSWIENLSRVVELDPGFAQAWFRLANANGWLYSLGYDASEERQRLTLEAAQRVADEAPGSALAASAMGQYLYRVERDYDRALVELTRAVELDPNSSTVYWLHGSVLRRRADFEAAVESYRAAVALDPHNPNHLRQLGIALQHLRRFEAAIDTLDRAIELSEERAVNHYVKVETLWSWAGHLAAARQALEAFPAHQSAVGADYLWYWQTVFEGEFGAAAERMQTTAGEWLGMPIDLRPRELLAGLASVWLGEPDPARRQFESAVVKLRGRLADAPDNEKALSSLGVTLAALGRRDEAIEAAVRATEIVPLATDPWFAQAHIEDLAWVHTLLGDYDSALEQLEILLERPSRVTISRLELDPRWAPLRDQPRFLELKAKFGGGDPVAERVASRDPKGVPSE